MVKQSSIALLGFLLLSGCGESYSTPLSHALVALRAGNAKEMQAAKDEADAEVKTAIQPGQDLCAMSAADIAKYNAQSVIAKLDQPEILKLPEEERLLFALKYVSEHSHVWPGSFLENAPFLQAVKSGARSNNCDSSKQMAAMAAGGTYMQDDDEARLSAINSWMESLKKKHGDKLDDAMRSAVRGLQNVGYSSTWPAIVRDDWSATTSFADAQGQLRKN
jgi:hypothetical protein